MRVISATNADLAGDDRRGAVPRGPVLPPQRDRTEVAAARAAPRRHPAARAPLPAGRQAPRRGGRTRAARACLAGQRARAAQRAAARGTARARRRTHAPPTSACRRRRSRRTRRRRATNPIAQRSKPHSTARAACSPRRRANWGCRARRCIAGSTASASRATEGALVFNRRLTLSVTLHDPGRGVSVADVGRRGAAGALAARRTVVRRS